MTLVNIILRVFSRDVGGLWVGSVITLLALGWLTWVEWASRSPALDRGLHNREGLPLGVFVLCSWLLVVRLIQRDPPGGARAWPEVLSAKMLFIFVFLAAPLALSQLALLLAYHLPVAPEAGHILFTTMTAISFGVLPWVGIASMTRTWSQWPLGVFMLILIFVVLTVAHQPREKKLDSTDWSWAIRASAFAAFALTGVVLRYWRQNRKITGLFWGLGMVTFASVPFARLDRVIVEHEYPIRAIGDTHFYSRFAPEEKTPGEDDFEDKTVITLLFPFVGDGSSDEWLMSIDALALCLDLPVGHKWELSSDGLNRGLSVDIDRADYERFKRQLLSAHLALALRELHSVRRQQVAVPNPFEFPHSTYCWVPEHSKSFYCRSSVNGPTLAMRAAVNQEGHCAERRADSDRPLWRNVTGLWNPSLLINPVALRTFYPACPHETVIFRSFEMVQRSRVYIDLGHLRLADFVSSGSIVF